MFPWKKKKKNKTFIYIQLYFKVYEFADRLKFYDPVLEKTLDDPQITDGNFNSAMQNIEDQKWLQQLRGLALQYQVFNSKLY